MLGAVVAAILNCNYTTAEGPEMRYAEVEQ
jgi:hypothetical protein